MCRVLSNFGLLLNFNCMLCRGRGRGGMGGGYGGGFRQDMQMREQMMMEREAYGRQLVGGDYGGYDDYSANGGGGYDFTSDQTGGDGNGFGLW